MLESVELSPVTQDMAVCFLKLDTYRDNHLHSWQCTDAPKNDGRPLPSSSLIQIKNTILSTSMNCLMSIRIFIHKSITTDSSVIPNVSNLDLRNLSRGLRTIRKRDITECG